MDNNDIKSYIEKLKSMEKLLTEDSIDSPFMDELDQVLNKLTTDVKDHVSDHSFDLEVKFKKLTEDAVTPSYSNVGDAGLDLTVNVVHNESVDSITYGFGIAVEIPNGYVGLLFPRSSVRKYDIILSNCVGVIDSTYRGEIQSTFNKIKDIHSMCYGVGERAAQMIIIPYQTVKLTEVEELSNTKRGSRGFGSTGS
jgi:dUTP pyrophosphatase